MRKLVLSLGLCLCLALPSLALAAGPTDAKDLALRLQAAQEYWKIAEVREQIQETIQRISTQLPPEQQKKFMAQAKGFFDQKRMDDIQKRWVAMCAQVFTAKELQTMVKFYGSPEGIAIREKMPTLIEGNAKIVGGDLNTFLTKEQERMAKEQAAAAPKAPAKDNKGAAPQPAPKADKAPEKK